MGGGRAGAGATSLALLMALTLTMTMATSTSAQASGERFAVVIGNNDGGAGEQPLRYAEADALKVFETLRDVGGVSAADMTLLVGESAATVRAGISAMNARVRQSEGGMLVVYYSGHADADALHLGRERLPLTELNDIVVGSAAQFRVLVVDACRSGALTSRKGGVPDSPIAMDASGAVDAEGFVVLTASAAGEDAQESDALRGSFFTHHWVSGLRGAADLDDDGVVSLEESYRHAFTQTVRQSSATMAGTQHPTYRYDVTGAGSVVLSRPRSTTRGGTLVFPPALDVLVFDDNAAGRVVAELPRQVDTGAGAERGRSLRVEAGRYFIRGRGDDAVYEGSVVLRGNERVVVDVGAFERIDYARLVRKGVGEKSTSHELRLGPALRSAIIADNDVTGAVCLGGRAGYSFVARYLNVDVNAGACGYAFDNGFVKAQHTEGHVDVGLSTMLDLPLLSVGVGAFVGGGVVQQRFETTGKAPDRHTGLGILGLRGLLRVPLPAGFLVGADVEGATYAFSALGAGADTDNDQGEDVGAGTVGVATPLTARASLWAGWQF